MSQPDFYGSWSVTQTAGTIFGVGSRVTIDGTETSLRMNIVNVDGSQVPLSALRYNAQMDAIQAMSGTSQVFISHYEDLSQNDDLLALCSLVVHVDEDNHISGHSVWTAELDQRIEGEGPTSSPGVSGLSFDGDYIVRSTVNAQFGVLSNITIGSRGTSFAIKNAFGEPLPEPDEIEFDPSSSSLKGSMRSPVNGVPGQVQASLAEVLVGADSTPRRLLYGLASVGDPEQAGTWGAEDQGGGDGDINESLGSK